MSALACLKGCRSRRVCPRRSLNDHSGARTGLASLATGVIVLATLLVLAPVFSILPKPVLAALIIEAVVMGMMDVPEMRRLARVVRFDFWIAVALRSSPRSVGIPSSPSTYASFRPSVRSDNRNRPLADQA